MESRAIVSRADAKAQGLTRYFSGEPCPHGHVAERRTRGGNCLACGREDARKRRAANPEKARQRVRKWEAANPKKKRESVRNWCGANRQKLQAARRKRDRKWRDNNPEKARALDRERNRKRRAANTEKVNAMSAAAARKRRAKKFAADLTAKIERGEISSNVLDSVTAMQIFKATSEAAFEFEVGAFDGAALLQRGA